MAHLCFIKAGRSQTSPTPSKPGFDLTAAQHGIAMELRLRCNGRPESASPDWLDEVRETRGRVCYEQGRRPQFLMPDGRFRDSDEYDPKAFHILARSRGLVVGCARVMPLANSPCSMVASVLGNVNIQLDTILRNLGVTTDRLWEASRWVVLPEFRGRLGRSLVAAGWAVGCWFSMELCFVLAGTREGQDMALSRMDTRPLRGIPIIPSHTFDDELRLFYFDAHPPDMMRRQINQATVALDLESLLGPFRVDGLGEMTLAADPSAT